MAQNNNTFFTNDVLARVNTRMEIQVQRRQQAYNMTHYDADSATRHAIAVDEEWSFIRELLPIIVGALAAFLMLVFGRKCSVM